MVNLSFGGKFTENVMRVGDGPKLPISNFDRCQIKTLYLLSFNVTLTILIVELMIR